MTTSIIGSTEERDWQKMVLNGVEELLNQYRIDAQVPEVYSELRVSDYSESNYYALLGDRKLLIEYIEQEDFPECGRPKLSGLTPN